MSPGLPDVGIHCAYGRPTQKIAHLRNVRPKRVSSCRKHMRCVRPSRPSLQLSRNPPLEPAAILNVRNGAEERVEEK